MISDQPAVFPKVVWDLATPRRVLRAHLGVAAIRRLHATSRAWDLVLFFGTWAFAGLTTAALIILPFGPLWVVAGLLQQIATMNCLYAVRHDIFFHRGVGGRLGEALAVLCSLPLLNTYAGFLQHEDHHRHVGWDLFEEPMAHLDRRWKRWFCLTTVGAVLMFMGRLRSADAPQPNRGFTPPESFRRRLRRERRIHQLFALVLVAATIRWPEIVGKGFVLPTFLFTGLIVMIRIAFQHSETDRNNPFHLSVYYRPNRLLALLFFNTLGAGHLVHHIYPRIPIYRIGEAVRLMHPVLVEKGVPERGMLEVLWRYFVRGEAYREPWGELPAQARPRRR